MANNDAREKQVGNLTKAALGAGVAVAFFSRSDIGRELATTGFSRLRNGFLNASEQMRGKTLRSMWGHGADDLKKATKAFKSGLDSPNINRTLPVSEHNLVGAFLTRKEYVDNYKSKITTIFNKDVMPKKYRDTVFDVLGKDNYSEQELRLINQLVDRLVTKHDESIISMSDGYEPNFSEDFQVFIKKNFADHQNTLLERLSNEVSNIPEYKEQYITGEGTQVVDAIIEQLNLFETYQKKFTKQTFMGIASGGQAATVKNALAHAEQFEDQMIGNYKVTDLFTEMVAIDERFGDLIIDHSLKYIDGEFYNYTGLKDTINSAQDIFLDNIGRILKPLEVAKHIRESPNEFYIAKETLDYQLKAIAEDGDPLKALDESYIRLFDQTYRIGENGLEHVEALDGTYLTPAAGFEGKHMRYMAGNYDYNVKDDDRKGLAKLLDIRGKIKPKDLKMGNGKEAVSTFDQIMLNLSGNDVNDNTLYYHAKRLLEDLNNDEELTSLPSLDAIEKIRNSQHFTRQGKNKSQLLLDRILGTDEDLMNYLSQITTSTQSDLYTLAKSYQKNPTKALNRKYKHGNKKTSFLEEARIELFKEAMYSTDDNILLGSTVSHLENILSGDDLKKSKHLTYFSYLQQASKINLKTPNIVSERGMQQANDTVINFLTDSSSTSRDAQSYFRNSAKKQSFKHLNDEYHDIHNMMNVSVAQRTNSYIHIKKGVINPLDIIETVNNFSLARGLQKGIDIVKQYTGGRNNFKDVTTQTLYPYFNLFRIQIPGLGFSRDSTGSTFDLAKNILMKRVLPAYVAGLGLSYLNYEGENLFGQSFTEMGAEATAKVDLGVRSVLDVFQNPFKDAYYWFTPLNYISGGEYQNAKERKAWYENGYSPVKQSKFWMLGSSEFFGGRTLFYEPNYVKRSQENWRDIGVYGSSEEKWKHSIIPTPRHPLSTIRYLMNPYWLEEKNAISRPYPVSGSMFDPNTPWGSIGNATIGQLIKPPKRLNQDRMLNNGVDILSIIEQENNRIKDEARSAHIISVKSSDTAIESNVSLGIGGSKSGIAGSSFGSGSGGSGSGDIGQFVLQEDRKSAQLNLIDQMQISIAKFTHFTRNRTLNQIETINFAIKEKSKWSYGNDTQFFVDIKNAKLNGDLAFIHDKDVQSDLRNLSSTEDMLLDVNYSINQLRGVYNFLGELVIPRKKTFAYNRSSDMYSTTRGFWESGIDGLDNSRGIMEIARRFIPNQDRNRIRINPLKNNMPSWMPSRLMYGDPYTQIKKGEMRLPGPAYEAMNSMNGFDSFYINSDFIGKDNLMANVFSSRSDKPDVTNKYQEALLLSGEAIAINKGIEDQVNFVRGTYDALIHDETSDDKQSIVQMYTLSSQEFQSIAQSGARKEDLKNVNYYLGQEDLSKGYVTYIDKATNKMLSFDIHFSEMIYRQTMAELKRTREEIMDNITKGTLSPYELYDDYTRFKILADVAPGSEEYKKYKKLAQENLSNASMRKDYYDTLNRVDKQSQKHKFYNYKFINVNTDKKTGVIESITGDQIKLVDDNTTYLLAGLRNYQKKVYNYLAPGMKVQIEHEKRYGKSTVVQAGFHANGLNINRQMMRENAAERNDDGSAMATRAILTRGYIALGAPFEMLSHMPIAFFHNKFLKVNTPYESWMQENIYGSKFSNWDHPIQTMIKPAFQQAWGSSYTQALVGAGLFALNEFASETLMTKGQKTAARFAHTFLTPGAFAGEITERVFTLNSNIFKKPTSGMGARIGSVIGLGGFLVNNTQDPLLASASGAGLGYSVAKFLNQNADGKTAAIMGLGVGLTASAIRTNGFQHNQINSEYIPGDTKKRWELEEYFDRLEYIKYKGLYSKAARLAKSEENVDIDKIFSDLEKKEKKQKKTVTRLMKSKDAILRSSLDEQTKSELLYKIDAEIDDYLNPSIDVPATPYTRLAIGYRQAMESTVYALDETSSWAQILRALEPYERDYFLEFVKETNPRKQKKILKAMSPYKQKILQNAWGRKAKDVKSNVQYFRGHNLPGPLWKGWNAKESLDAYKVKTIVNEGMMLSDFGLYESELNKPEVMQATPIQYEGSSNLLLARASLAATLNGLGIEDHEISILPSQQSGIQTFINVATVNTEKFKNKLTDLGNTLLF